MSTKQNRADLEALNEANILTGQHRTTAQSLRDFNSALIISLLNILDDKDQNDGYLGIDTNGRVNITKINAVSQTGKFLKDDGTWAIMSPRITSIANTATPTPDTSTTDQYNITALSGSAAFVNPVGGANDGQLLMIRIYSAASQLLSFGSAYRFDNFPPPTATAAGRTSYLIFKWNAADSKWDAIISTFTISLPTIVIGAGAGGTGSSANISGTIHSGTITLITGASPTTNSVQATITYPGNFTAPTGASIMLFQGGDFGSANLGTLIRVYAVSTATGWQIKSNATVALPANATYQLNYIVGFW